MKQFQFDYHSITSLKRDLDKINLWCKTKVFSHVVFQIYSDSLDRGQIDLVCDVVSQNFPEAICMGCSTNGNILEGRLSSASISIVCTIFEYPTTKVELCQFAVDDEKEKEVTSRLIEMIEERPWVKAIMLNVPQIGCTACRYCTDGCPMRIAIPDVFRAVNTMRLYNEEFRPKNFYRGLLAGGNGRAADCIGCGQCEGVCPQHLPIIELLKEASAKLDA